LLTDVREADELEEDVKAVSQHKILPLNMISLLRVTTVQSYQA